MLNRRLHMLSSPPAVARAPGLLGKLGKLGMLTAIRDTELVEQSLLRTLGPLLGVLDTSLYRLNERHQLARVLHYHRTKVVDADGVVRMTERIEELSQIADVPPSRKSSPGAARTWRCTRCRAPCSL